MERVDRVAFDWIDALLILVVCGAWTFVLHLLGADSGFAKGAVAAALVAVLFARRKIFGMPIREVRHVASFVGTFATMLIVFGMLGGALGAFLLFRHGTHEAPAYETSDPAMREELERSAREAQRHFLVIDLILLAGGASMLVAGGLLDRWWVGRTRREP
ncbi:MAG: hypothetical protein ACXVEF_40320 [Polyangiales bacterium]